MGGGGPTIVRTDSDKRNHRMLLELASEEFISAIEKKDFKGIREALKAIVLLIKDLDEGQDDAIDTREV